MPYVPQWPSEYKTRASAHSCYPLGHPIRVHLRASGTAEQERKPAALARPRHLDTLDPVIGAIVLKEIQMAPGELAEVVRLARLAAVQAGKPRPA